jgi:hypothetical protein
MAEKKQKFDWNSPEVQAQVREIVQGSFVREGMMIAFPTCFPGATVPIRVNESRITALDVTSEGTVYGGTSGRLCHIFVGMFHGTTGMVFDMGTVAGTEHCAAVCCGKKNFVACVNEAGGRGRILAGELQDENLDLIQEWGFRRKPFHDLGTVNNECIVHAVADASREFIVGVTPYHLFTVDLNSSKIEVVGEIAGNGRLAVASRGSIVGYDGAGYLWSYDVGSRTLRPKAVTLPAGHWGRTLPLIWTRSHRHGLLYTADNEGNLFSFDETKGFSSALGKTPLAPVGPMAMTLDGRVFGFCGTEMAKMFSYHPVRREVRDLGVAVSVIERRRYGYMFSDAVIGPGGEIYFGEEDNLGHLWLYFPKIEAGPA